MHTRQPALAVFDHTPTRRGVMTLAVGFLGVCLVRPAIRARAQQAEPQVVSRSLSAGEAGTILGRNVFDSAGANVGRLVDVLVDQDGKTLAGVIDVGGFLGVGTRRVAVAWRLLHFVHDNDGTRVVMDLTLDTAAGAPEFLGPENTLIVIDRAPP